MRVRAIASAGARAYNGVWTGAPGRVQTEPLVKESKGKAPYPEAAAL